MKIKEPTLKEVVELVTFERAALGSLVINNVLGDVWGGVCGNVYGGVKGNIVGDIRGTVEGDIKGNVCGTINGRQWQSVETTKEKAIRLIREGRGDEAIQVLRESE